MIKKILIGLVIFTVLMLIIGLIAGEDTTQNSVDKTAEPAPVVTEKVETKPEVKPDPSAEPEPVLEAEPTETTRVEKETKEVETAKPTAKPIDDGKLTDEKKSEIIEYFKGDDEPTVVDAVMPYDTLKLGVHNDGSNRDGFAEYACQILQSDFNVQELVVVRIIDIDKLVSTDKWETIGEYNCNY